MILRTYALYNCSKRILAMLIFIHICGGVQCFVSYLSLQESSAISDTFAGSDSDQSQFFIDKHSPRVQVSGVRFVAHYRAVSFSNVYLLFGRIEHVLVEESVRSPRVIVL